MNWRIRTPVNAKELADRVRSARTKKKLSQSELAMQMTLDLRELHNDPHYEPIGVEWIRRIEQGKMDGITAERGLLLSTVLDVHPDEILPKDTIPQGSTYDLVMNLRSQGLRQPVIDQILELVETNKPK